MGTLLIYSSIIILLAHTLTISLFSFFIFLLNPSSSFLLFFFSFNCFFVFLIFLFSPTRASSLPLIPALSVVFSLFPSLSFQCSLTHYRAMTFCVLPDLRTSFAVCLQVNKSANFSDHALQHSNCRVSMWVFSQVVTSLQACTCASNQNVPRWVSKNLFFFFFEYSKFRK